MRPANAEISNRNWVTRPQNEGVSTNIVPKAQTLLKSILGPKTEISPGRVVVAYPLRTVSEANCFEKWKDKHKRHKAQKSIIWAMLNRVRYVINLPCKILFTRYAPKLLDKHDNLPMSFKYICDTCCEIITGNHKAGMADSDERISIVYDQVKSKEYGIIIEITYEEL